MIEDSEDIVNVKNVYGKLETWRYNDDLECHCFLLID